MAVACIALPLSVEDERTGLPITVDLHVSCPWGDWSPADKELLKRGESKGADGSTGDTKLNFDHPGRYLVLAIWQPSSATDEMVFHDSEYPATVSNQIFIAVRHANTVFVNGRGRGKLPALK